MKIWTKIRGGAEARKETRTKDDDSIDGLHAGGPSGFDKMVERYHRDVCRLVYRMTQNRADAEDITQEVFLKAFRSFHTLDRASSLKAWLFKIAYNRCIDHWRSDRPRDVMPSPPAEYHGPMASLEQKELQACLQAAIARLHDKQRATLIFRIFHQLSFGEIAEIMGSPLGTVKANYHHAVVRMRALLENSPV